MGVPAFFRWLSEKYPKIVQDILEERVRLVGDNGSVRIPFDATRPNPSGLECDNLYIDMNGIIHPCSHPEQGPQPKTEEEMYENVCAYVDRLFRIMRPRKLLYLAIDGVAPRAKMNQQRARRFRSAQEAREKEEIEENVRAELSKSGQKIPKAKKAWDSNVITPGTPFMIRLAEFIRFYIRKRLSTDKAWQNIRVIFSDASIPGEGEHKIMAHIRYQRSQPGYNPNLVHILHGLDADLIMLALATHETHFYISREEVLFGRKSQEQNEKRQIETMFREKQRALDEQAGEAAMQLLENKQKPLVRISIPILREYLAAEFESCITPGRMPFAPSFERLLDDIVFLCFFVGNDFLPHLPSLDIRDGALDYLFNVYKRILPSLGDYITNHGGQVDLSKVDVILAEVGSIEDYVFSMKHENETRSNQRREDEKARKKAANGRSLDNPLTAVSSQPEPKARGRAAKILARQEEKMQAVKKSDDTIKSTHMLKKENMDAAMSLKASLMEAQVKVEPKVEDVTIKQESAIKKESEDDDVDAEGSAKGGSTKRKLEEVEDEENVGEVGDMEEEFDADERSDEDSPKVEVDGEVDPELTANFKNLVKNKQQAKLDDYAKNVSDNVRLHESGWKDRYYSDKCKADDVAAHGGREHLFRSYVMGLCWVMRYYYDGCPSWKWYFPFHYAPFASDLRNIERFERDVASFEPSKPFNPVEQLMAVLPADSKHAIPKEARWLMTDPESPIIDFYPSDVPVDPNGKAMPWLWVVLLPFIDEDRLLSAMTPTMAKWTPEELLCNSRGLDDGYLFIHSKNPLATKLKTVLQGSKSANASKTRLNDAAAYGCPGFSGSLRTPLSNEVFPLDEDVNIEVPKCSERVEYTSHDSLFSDPILGNESLCVAFTEPQKLPHKSVLLPGSMPLPPSLTADDLRVRRPRLNRGGGTIANMGTSNGSSYQSGYGSMNIGSYERDLAQRTGRGNQMFQAGTRAWGAMEPAPKRQFQGRNPFQGQQPNAYSQQPQQHQSNPPWQQFNHQQYGNQQRGESYGQGYPPQQHMQRQVPQRGQPPPSHGRQGGQPAGRYPNYQQHPPQGMNQRQPPNWQASQQSRAPPPRQQQGPGAPRQQGFNFRGHSQAANQQTRAQPPQNQPHQTNRVNSNVMSSLKAQLASTLKQNRKQNNP